MSGILLHSKVDELLVCILYKLSVILEFFKSFPIRLFIAHGTDVLYL